MTNENWTEDKVFNPGSKEAVDQGCQCPTMDNEYGVGMDFSNGTRRFWINGNCPIHGLHPQAEETLDDLAKDA